MPRAGQLSNIDQVLIREHVVRAGLRVAAGGHAIGEIREEAPCLQVKDRPPHPQWACVSTKPGTIVIFDASTTFAPSGTLADPAAPTEIIAGCRSRRFRLPE